MNDNELMNRRRFFKKTAKEMLPMLGAFVAAPTVIMSTLTSCGCDDCEAACKDDCVGSCSTSCYDSCASSSVGGGCSNCSSSCSASSTSSTCSSCANDCSSSCKDTCQEGCKDSCSDTCKTTCSLSCEGSASGKSTTGSVSGHEYVDLGLSVLWATCNIGATKQQNFGDYFAFADTNGTVTGSISEDKVYYENLGLKAGDIISGTKYDIAKNKWGSGWRLPTKDELEELKDNCSFKYAYYLDDVKHGPLENSYGLTFTSKKNDQCVFLPFAGCKFSKDDTDESYISNEAGIYMSGNLITTQYSNFKNLKEACLHVTTEGGWSLDPLVHIDDSNLNSFISVRPVIERSYGDVLTCNGVCTANCSSDCSSTCKNRCGNDCIGGCKDGCSTGCKTTCQGECKEKCTATCADSCSSNCTSKCTATCADSCKAQTSQYCSNCANNCSSSCTRTCADACKAQTSQSCSNCGSDCSGKCGDSCQSDCSGSCGMGCAVTCGGTCSQNCIGNCSHYCTNSSRTDTSWCAGCVFYCNSYCANTCSSYCYSSCMNNGKIG